MAVLGVDRERFASAPGRYTAVVTARFGRTTTTTPVKFHVEPPSHDLTGVDYHSS